MPLGRHYGALMSHDTGTGTDNTNGRLKDGGRDGEMVATEVGANIMPLISASPWRIRGGRRLGGAAAVTCTGGQESSSSSMASLLLRVIANAP